MPEAITIPPAPVGVEDPNDLAYGKRSNFGIARWDDVEFHDRLAWLLEVIGIPLSVEYYTPRGGDPIRPTGYKLPVEVAFTNIGGTTYTTEAYDVRFISHVPLVALKTIFLKESLPTIETYPGFDVRHPKNGDPVGENWPEMEKFWTRPKGTLFHASSADGPTFAYEETFERSDARFMKHRWVVRSSGFWSEMADVWEKY